MKEFKVDVTPSGRYKVTDKHGFSVATLAHDKEDKQIAELFAAAPALLKALQLLLSDLSQFDMVFSSTKMVADAAISKALNH